MQQAISQFRLNINSVKNLHSLYLAFNQQNSTLDLSEILRAQIVLSVSALDCFVHDLIKLGTTEIYLGQRNFDSKTAIKPNFDENKLIYLLTKSKEEQINAIENYVRIVNVTKSFQTPVIIRENLLKIGIDNVWNKVSQKINIPQTEIESTLQLIIERRNKISHEADIDIQTNTKREINPEETISNVEFIEKICETISTIA